MQNPINPMTSGRPALYIFLAGLVIGIFIGWSLSGVIGLLFRVVIFALAVALIVLAVNFWQKTREQSRDATIEARWRETGDSKNRR
jgi:uncharacterized membrane protein YfcA